MNTLEAIFTRRSIRKFTSEPVKRDDIRTLLRAAMHAPTAGNQQDWCFVVVDDRALLARVPEFHPYARMAPQAAAGILVCADLRLEQRPGYWVQDCAAAAQNILLAAHDMGLGAVWTGIHPRPERIAGVRNLFNLPDEVKPVALILIGHAAETVYPEDRYREDRIHWNKW